MAHQNSTSLTFDLNESVWLDHHAQSAEITSLSLEPVVEIVEDRGFVTIKGYLELLGRFETEDEGEDTLDLEASSLAEQLQYEPFRVEQKEIYQREHKGKIEKHFPVDITLPAEKVKDLREVYFNINQFDYSIKDQHRLNIEASIEILGVTIEEQKDVILARQGDEVRAEPFSFPDFEVTAVREDSEKEEEILDVQRQAGGTEEATRNDLSLQEDTQQDIRQAQKQEQGQDQRQEEDQRQEQDQMEGLDQKLDQDRELEQKLNQGQQSIEERSTEWQEKPPVFQQDQEEEAQEREQDQEPTYSEGPQQEFAHSLRTEDVKTFDYLGNLTRKSEEEAIDAEEKISQVSFSTEVLGQVDDEHRLAEELQEIKTSFHSAPSDDIPVERSDDVAVKVGQAESVSSFLSQLMSGKGDEENEVTRLKMCIIQKDESLEEIAGRYELRVTEIMRYNRLETQEIRAGQILYIPKN